MSELRAWKIRITFQIPFQTVFWHERCFTGFSHILISCRVRAGLWSDGLAAGTAFKYRLILKFFLKDAAQTDSSCGFVLLSGSVTWFSMLFILFCNNGDNSAFSGVSGYHKWHHQSQSFAEAPHATRDADLLFKCRSKNNSGKFDPDLWKPKSCHQSWHCMAKVRHCHCIVCFS